MSWALLQRYPAAHLRCICSRHQYLGEGLKLPWCETGAQVVPGRDVAIESKVFKPYDPFFPPIHSAYELLHAWRAFR